MNIKPTVTLWRNGLGDSKPAPDLIGFGNGRMVIINIAAPVRTSGADDVFSDIVPTGPTIAVLTGGDV